MFGLFNKEKPAAPEAAPADTTAPDTTEPAAQPTETSTLDKFKDLWQPSTNSKETEPLFAVDQSKLMEAAGKLDFTKVIKPEHAQAIARGGDEAMTAFAQSLNAVAQATFANSMAGTAKLIEQAMAKKEAEFEAKIPNAIKNYSLDASISSDPVLKHPAAKPVVAAIAQSMAAKFPEASIDELRQMAGELLADIAKAGNSKQGTTEPDRSSPTAPQGTFDWDTWLQQN